MHRHFKSAASSLRMAAMVAVLVPGAIAQGDNGFLRGAGKTDLSLSYSMDLYDHFWMGSKRVSDPAVGEITRESVNLHIAHGVREDLDFVLTAAFVDVENDGLAPFDDESDLQDLSAGIKWRVAPESELAGGMFSFLLAPAIKVPMVHYENNTPTAIGDGQLDLRNRLIAHWRNAGGWWLAAETGYDYRTEAPGNEIPFNVTLGIPVLPKVTVMPFYAHTQSFGGRSYNIGQGAFPGVEEDIKRFGVSIFARVTDALGFNVGLKSTMDGKNTGDVDGGWWVGLTWKL
jgi:hypothetical protein